MASLLNTVSPAANLSPKTKRPTCGGFLHSQVPNLHTFSMNKGFSRVSASTQIAITPKDAVFNLPNWRGGRNDPRDKELRVYDAFLHLEYLVGKGQKPEVTQATQLLYDLCKFNKARKAVKVMDMMVDSGIIPDAASYTYLVNFLCRRGNVGYALQLVEKMEGHGLPTNTVTYNTLVKGLCMHGNLKQSLQLLDKLRKKGL
ncbi:pentatricopeptide repeat-containing protein At1g79080, chloroplastic-like, partial [Vigna umbellata]